jgi:hypothetical protein
MCLGCVADANLEFRFRVGNDFVPPTAVPQIFEFDMVVLVDGTTEIDRYPVRVMVPPLGGGYGAGFYENTYDSDLVCEVPPERPEWGELTWIGATPSDSEVTFEFFTADTLADLDSQIPVPVTFSGDPVVQSHVINISDELIAAQIPMDSLFLRVRAKLQGSTDGNDTPIFQGWSMDFNCVPKD